MTAHLSHVRAARFRVPGWVGALVLASALALAPVGAGADQKATPPGLAKKADRAALHAGGQGTPAALRVEGRAPVGRGNAAHSTGAGTTANRLTTAVVTAPVGAAASAPLQAGVAATTPGIAVVSAAAPAPAAARVVRPVTSRRPATRATVSGTIPAVVPPAPMPPTVLGPVPLIVPVVGTQGSIPSATLPWQWLLLLAAVGILFVGMIVAGRRRNGEAGGP